jgi:hypothetical protein
VYERANEQKINSPLNRDMHKVYDVYVHLDLSANNSIDAQKAG